MERDPPTQVAWDLSQDARLVSVGEIFVDKILMAPRLEEPRDLTRMENSETMLLGS